MRNFKNKEQTNIESEMFIIIQINLFHRNNFEPSRIQTNLLVKFKHQFKFYPKDKYDHALRVANYVAENNLIPDDQMDDCIALAIMHDLL